MRKLQINGRYAVRGRARAAALTGLGFALAPLGALAPLAPLEALAAQNTPLSDTLSEDQLNLAAEVEAIDHVWSGHRVNAQMIQRGTHQFIAYYDAMRQMSIAHRTDQRAPWRYHKLPSYVGWDSHNYVTIDIDEAGYIHVLGNMHADPIVYFRSTEPYNVRSLVQIDYLENAERETSVTYPRFMHDPDGRLIAIFRIGSSGDGKYYFHRFDTATLSWSLLHDRQFFDGEDERGAYYIGPEKGPDGLFHTIWVWRETPSAATNNNLSYVRSRDLVNWEDSNGKPVSLPIIRSIGEVVDPVPVGGGMLNGQTKLGFDNNNRPMIAYYKHDANENTQIMLARKMGEGWKIFQISDWADARQNLDRGGSLTVSILVPENPYMADDGTIRVRSIRDGAPIEFIVDAATTETRSSRRYDAFPPVIAEFQDNPALTQYVHKADVIAPDSAPDSVSDTAYDFYISWEANPSFQDQARGDIPPPSTLRLHKIPR